MEGMVTVRAKEPSGACTSIQVEPPHEGTLAFRIGDEVVLVQGPHKYCCGAFLRLKKDPEWADIVGHDGKIMSERVEWLARPTPGTPGHNAESRNNDMTREQVAGLGKPVCAGDRPFALNVLTILKSFLTR